MRKILSLIMVVFISLAMTGCGSKSANTSDQSSEKVERVNIATGTTSGAYYPIGNAMAKIWTDKVPGVKASAQSTEASAANMNFLQQKEAEVAFTMANVAVYAYQGQDNFSGRANKDLRGMTFLYPNVTQIVVRKDSGINSVKDLQGKRFVPGATGSGTVTNSKEVLDIFGLNFWDKDKSNVNADYVGFTEASELLKNKQADAANFSGAMPLAAIMDVSNSIDVKLISLEPDMIQKIVEKYPFYYEYVIPKGTYKGQEEDVHTVALANLLVTRADLSEDLIYNLTKGIYENLPDLYNAHAITKNIKKEDSGKGMGPIPLHPGAIKYFKEVGVLK
ncbi:TRAP transporter solute receptor, TAXI family [Desulfosporosinus orientis DSM 765]|uniref:TRAP transporter solute receptor, TAXI family n=1 Tax=Desulfosporosinus orientis (strain ATCC 19365 / DSM 765 / NCIMB 8382 / VKM B-1628 / Singapore I) TaxID=768706 RepID=G7WCW2_DESOD|nr:TAXI family TRAP transporter solute-binding subunit [Desulfosporosinus orientis]AET66868.1 TRAP transporter solute receptor, TAXI family [Desulfosporosinus orientis DSM 765]